MGLQLKHRYEMQTSAIPPQGNNKNNVDLDLVSGASSFNISKAS